MPEKRVTIGVSVNLQRYENLRIEVEGEAESLEDADALVAYLDSVLGRLGRMDPETAKQIDSYRHRVLTPPDARESVDKGEKNSTLFTPEEAPLPAGDEMEEKPVDAPPSPSQNAKKRVKKEETPGEEAPAAPPPAGEGAVCPECGAQVSKQQEKLSLLFMGRVLCRDCMDRMQK